MFIPRNVLRIQWVPFFLLLQAACFRAPSLLWKLFSLSSGTRSEHLTPTVDCLGVRVHDIVKRATDPANMEDNTRAKNLDVLTKHLSHALRFQDRVSRKQQLLHKILKFFNVTYSVGVVLVHSFA